MRSRLPRSIVVLGLTSLVPCLPCGEARANVKPASSAGSDRAAADGRAGDDEAALARALGERCARLWTGNFVKLAAAQLAPDHPLNRGGLQAVLDLAFKPAGGLVAVTVAVGSGNAEFDEGAVEVARDAARGAPRPPALLSDDGLVHVRWLLERDEGRCGDLAPHVVRLPMPGAVEVLTAQGRWDEALARLKEAPSPAAVRAYATAFLRAQAPRATAVDAAAGPGACERLLPALAAGAAATARQQAVRALRGEMAEPCVAPLAAIAGSAGEPLELRVAALAALGSHPGEAAEKAVREYLDAQAPALQAAAIAAWATPERGRKALFLLTPLLKHGHLAVRTAAAAGLVRAAGEPALEQLYLLWKESAPEPFEAVAAELGHPGMGGVPAADFLAKMARRSDARVRLAAALALSRRADEAARGVLQRLREDPDLRVRAVATSTGSEAEVAAAARWLRAQGTPADLSWVHDTLLDGRGELLAAQLFVDLFEAGSGGARLALVRKWAPSGSGATAGRTSVATAAAR